MLPILICDDDPFLLKLEAEKINEFIIKKWLDAAILCIASCSEELLTFLQNHAGEYLIFLDLDFGANQLNGLDLAKKIKHCSPFSKIVFVTNHKEMAMQVLTSGVEPFGFLEKTTDMMRLSLGYANYIVMATKVLNKNLRESSASILLTVGNRETISLYIEDIAYVEALKQSAHYVKYHTLDGSAVTTRASIENTLAELGSQFVRCHRSILVNKAHILSLKDGMLKLSNGDQLPCSIRQRSEIKKCLP